MLHGSQEAQEQQSTADAAQGNSNAHVYEIRRISVRADHKEEFRNVLSELLPKVAQKYREHVLLAGNWEVTVGDLDTFYQIWRYDSYAAYDQVWEKSREDPDAIELRKRIAPALQSHSNWLTQAFTFWKPTLPAPPTGIYELRTYHLKPGNLLQWERDWRHGLEARRPFVEPMGAWFTHVGGLHTVFHIWAYPSMEQRERTRAAAWQVETWSATVNKTSPMIDKMHSQIMKAQPLSGL